MPDNVADLQENIRTLKQQIEHVKLTCKVEVLQLMLENRENELNTLKRLLEEKNRAQSGAESTGARMNPSSRRSGWDAAASRRTSSLNPPGLSAKVKREDIPIIVIDDDSEEDEARKEARGGVVDTTRINRNRSSDAGKHNFASRRKDVSYPQHTLETQALNPDMQTSTSDHQRTSTPSASTTATTVTTTASDLISDTNPIQARLARFPTFPLPTDSAALTAIPITSAALKRNPFKGVLAVTTDLRRTNQKVVSIPAVPHPHSSRPLRESRHVLFMYVSSRTSPYAPREPGAPGLLFGLRGWREPVPLLTLPASGSDSSSGNGEMDGAGHSVTVIVMLTELGGGSTSKACNYNIMGEYRLKREEDLSGDEFRWLPEHVKYEFMDIVTTRERGKPALDAILKARRHHGSSNKFAGGSIKRKDVIEAFEHGHERITVWSMECIGFDVSIKRLILNGDQSGTCDSNSESDNDSDDTNDDDGGAVNIDRLGSDVDRDNDDGDKTLSSMDSDGLDFVGTEDTSSVSMGELKRKRWSVRQLGFEGRQARALGPTLALPGLVISNGSRKRRRCGDMTA